MTKRRTFLGIVTAGGTAGLSALGLPGCSTGDDAVSGEGSPAGETTSKNLYFDLSRSDTEKYNYSIRAGAQRQSLSGLSEAGLVTARRRNGFLALVPKEHLTHEAAITVAASEPQLIFVERKRKDGKGIAVPQAICISIPDNNVVSARIDALGEMLKKRTEPPLEPKLKLYDINASEAEIDDPVGAAHFINSVDTARALVQFHPDLISFEASSAAIVAEHIVGPKLDALARYIDDHPETYLGIQDLTNEDGTPLLVQDDTGASVQAQAYTLPEAIKSLIGDLAADVVEAVKNDPRLGADIAEIDLNDPASTAALSGKLWTTETVDSTSYDVGTLKRVASASGINWQLTRRPANYPGLTMEVVAQRTTESFTYVTVRMVNRFVRYLGIYSRFFDANGKPVRQIPSDYKSFYGVYLRGFDADGYVFNDFVSAQAVLYGINTWSVNSNIEIPIPSTAESFEIVAGGLGAWQPAREIPQSVKTVGQLLTGAINLCVPIGFLAYGAYSGLTTFTVGLTKVKVATVLLQTARLATTFPGVDASNGAALSAWGLDLTKTVLLTPALWELFIYAVGTSYLASLIPFIGMGLQVAGAAQNAANLARSTADILQSYDANTNTVVKTKTLTIFAGTGIPNASRYLARVITSSGTVFDSTVNAPNPGTIKIPDLPLGGTLNVSVSAYEPSGTMCGYASDFLSNASRNDESVTLTMKRIVRPVSSTTSFQHTAFTVPSDFNQPKGTYVLQWRKNDRPPPGAEGQFPQVSAYGNLTLFPVPMVYGDDFYVGRTWSTSAISSPLASCYSINSAQISVLENSFGAYDGRAEDAGASKGHFYSRLKDGSNAICGVPYLTQIAYDVYGGDPARNYYVDRSADGFNYVRQIRLDPVGRGSDYDLPGSNRSMGRFNLPSDCMLVHPSGAIVSLSSEIGALELLFPSSKPVADRDAPLATMIGGQGTRPGLMQRAVRAVVSSDGAILLMEQDGMRVQALDLAGNPVARFGSGRTKNIFALESSASQNHISRVCKLVDIAIEESGYMYVLYFDPTRPVGGANGYLSGYVMNIYDDLGNFLQETKDFSAARIAVDRWRAIYAMNFAPMTATYPGTGWPVDEPSISLWLP